MSSRLEGIERTSMAGKVEIEDALKHFRGCELEGGFATLKSVAGGLGVTPSRASEIVGVLLDQGLVESSGSLWRLTERGRGYANDVVRAHRVYETYLANETGNPSPTWHAMAEAKEHELTEDQVASMERQLGKPRFDPHGDPIPSPSGELPGSQGEALTALGEGACGVIDHIEDEPDTVYADLARFGLAPGMRVRITRVTPTSFEIEAEGRRLTLDRLHAANVHLTLSADEGETLAERLSDLPLTATARIYGLSRNCRGAERRRLLDLGIVAGNLIQAERESPFNGPRAYRICGTMIALRREQAEKVFINRIRGEGFTNER